MALDEGKFYVRRVCVPVILTLIKVQHLRHRATDTLHTTDTVGVVGAGGDFTICKKL